MELLPFQTADPLPSEYFLYSAPHESFEVRARELRGISVHIVRCANLESTPRTGSMRWKPQPSGSVSDCSLNSDPSAPE